MQNANSAARDPTRHISTFSHCTDRQETSRTIAMLIEHSIEQLYTYTRIGQLWKCLRTAATAAECPARAWPIFLHRSHRTHCSSACDLVNILILRPLAFFCAFALLIGKNWKHIIEDEVSTQRAHAFTGQNFNAQASFAATIFSFWCVCDFYMDFVGKGGCIKSVYVDFYEILHLTVVQKSQ